MPPPSPLARTLRKVRGLVHLDLGPPNATTLVSGMARSGTTWVGNLINHDHSYRTLFEPFHPAKVRAARGFPYLPYLRPGEDRPELAAAAERILSGKVRGWWVDHENRGLVHRKRLVKDVRTHLMLGWLRVLRPKMPIVWLVRNPWSVAASWLHLGWGGATRESPSDFAFIRSNGELLHDLPVAAQALRRMDTLDLVERIAFHWCVFVAAPALHLRSTDRLLVRYEDLLLRPEEESRRILDFLGDRAAGGSVERALVRRSSTDVRSGTSEADVHRQVTGWQEALTGDRVERIRKVVGLFGLDRLYDLDGFPVGDWDRVLQKIV